MEKAFNNEKYLELQSKKIEERIELFGDKLYLEFGGKLFDDYHAARVLPGFLPDSKLKMLLTMKEKVEVVIGICANDIESNKIRSDLDIPYQKEVLRLIDAFRESELYVGSVVVTKYKSTPQVDTFILRLTNLGIKVYKHYEIPNYPLDVDSIISPNGFGLNDYIETTRPLVVVTAPGPGSGKMAICLSQLYHEAKKGVKAGYAKYETFPIYNRPLKHPLNLAYEAATADLNDVNLIDPYHLEAYNELAVNYNRDVEIFPIVKSMFELIGGTSPYKSPTDMGVNMVGFAIENEDLAIKASKNEIIRRFLDAQIEVRNGKMKKTSLEKISTLMSSLNITIDDRKCVRKCLEKAELANTNAMAIELPNGDIITAKQSELLCAPAALILKALKHLAGLKDHLNIISPSIIKPIMAMKTKALGNRNTKLHADEVLIALAISARDNPLAEAAYAEFENLRGAQAHSNVILPKVDSDVLKKLKIDTTSEPVAHAHKLYTK